MSFHRKSLNICSTLVAILLTLAVSSAPVMAQFPDIEIDVGDTVASPGAKNSVISVYMTNRVDTIAAFNIWLQLDRPDLMVFLTDTVTVFDTSYWYCNNYNGSNCVDSQRVLFDDVWHFMHDTAYLDTIGNFDTAGTLCSGWDLVDSRSISQTGADINIAGIADLAGGQSEIQGIPPSFSGGLLVKILADIFDVPDTLTDRTVNILVQTDFKDHFSLSKPDGTSLAYITEQQPDTACFRCTQWVEVTPGDTICANYIEITFGECDSIDVTMQDVIVLDTANVKIYNGSVTVGMSGVCGNTDGITDPLEVDISDLVFLVEYSFNGGPAPDPMWVSNVNCDNEAGDIGDVVAMVEFMFLGGDPICNNGAGCP